MRLSTRFFVLATLFLLVGLSLGIYMGASGNFAVATGHAHVNLVGFVLLMIFGLVYRAVPAMESSRLAHLHLWLHGVGAAGLTGMLLALELGRITEATMAVSAVFELAILLGVVAFLVNLLRNAREPATTPAAMARPA